MASTNKRDAQSPLLGDDSQMKRRNILQDPPALVNLDEISGESSQSDSEFDTTVKPPSDILKPSATLTEKVDSLIGRMDSFLECFSISQKKAAKKERKDNRKFKHLVSAHNDIASRVAESSSAIDARLVELEDRLARSENLNKDLSDKLTTLEANHDRHCSMQHAVNADTSKKLTALDLNQGYTDRNVLDLASEVKERKIIISRVFESRDEDVSTTALECINKVINAAISTLDPNEGLSGLRILMPSAIDNVFRIGKPRQGRFTRNISVTFLHKDDKTMVSRACFLTKNSEDIRFFITDDLTTDGRALKAQLKRIASSAKANGQESKISGNKVLVNSRPYASNELSLIPPTSSENLKQEKQIKGGIVYRGDRTIFSNFFPSPFKLGGEDYLHVEQYYQHVKACHHGDDATAERILSLSNPWRIKVLGDNIESNSTWLPRRMKVLYDGVSAKFRQNWPLHDELLRSKGLKLYEATTDLYFACGIGYDSKKWETMDWKGDNVAGLVVMKVREELLLELSGIPSNENTLTQIATDQAIPEHMEVSVGTHDACPLESTLIHQDEFFSDDHKQGHPPLSQSYTDAVKSPKSFKADFPPLSQRDRGQGSRRARNSGGRGRPSSSSSYQYSSSSYPRGNGRGSRRQQFRSSPGNSRRSQDKMSDDDKNFLFGYKPHEKVNKDGYTTPSPRKTVRSSSSNTSDKEKSLFDGYDSLKLTEHQKEGLVELGLVPSSDFVKNIISNSKRPAV